MQSPIDQVGSIVAGSTAASMMRSCFLCRDGPIDEVDPLWQVPQRFVARQPSPTGPGWEASVKWTNLGYDHCTWEV